MTRTEVSGSTQIPYYYHYNAHGDVVMVTKAGATSKTDLLVASYVYDAWGNIIYQEGSYAAKNPYRYAGYQFDTETNQYYLMARYYNPKAGVFTSIDPDSGEANDILSQNGYNYVSNNPVTFIDPYGHKRYGDYGGSSGGFPGGGIVRKPSSGTYKGSVLPVTYIGNLKLSSIPNLSRSTIISRLPKSWRKDYNGPYIHARDSNGVVRVRFDPPDSKTKYYHVHIFNSKGQPLNKNGVVVSKRSPSAHIRYKK